MHTNGVFVFGLKLPVALVRFIIDEALHSAVRQVAICSWNCPRPGMRRTHHQSWSHACPHTQGMYNARTLVRMEQQHNEDVAASASRADSEHKRTTGHGLSFFKEQPQPQPQQQQAGRPGSGKFGGQASMPATSSHGFDTGHGKARSGHSRRHRVLAAAPSGAAAA